MRLIDADELRKNMFDYAPPEMKWDRGDIEHKIGEMPTIDAIKVIRCKDCKCYKHEEEDEVGMGWCSNFKPASNERFICWDNWYCGDGQRKDG